MKKNHDEVKRLQIEITSLERRLMMQKKEIFLRIILGIVFFSVSPILLEFFNLPKVVFIIISLITMLFGIFNFLLVAFGFQFIKETKENLYMTIGELRHNTGN